MKFGLTDTVIESIQKIFEANSRVDAVIIFGSRAKGNFRDGSDIDLAMKGRDLDFDDLLNLNNKIEKLNLPYEIDLVNYSTIKEPALAEHIAHVGIEFYSRWAKYKFSDFALVNPPVKLKKGEVHSFVEMKDLSDGQKFCEPHQERETSGGARFQNGDTLFARITPCLENGKICQVRNLKTNIGFGSTEFHVFRGKENVSDTDFIFYLSRWDEVRNFAEMNFDGTSGRQRVPKEAFDNLFLNLPPLSEQKAIAEVLNSLDDKIDLLHQNNTSLENLAQTIFKKWFVEDADISWKEQTLIDIADHLKESINPSKYLDTIFHHYSLPAFDEGKNPIVEIGKEILSNKYKVVPNSILVSKLNPRFPRIWALYGNDVAANSICSTEFQIAKPKNISYFGFIYCFLKSYQVTQELTSSAGGTSGSHQRVNPDDIFGLSFLLPPINLIEKFDIMTKDILKKIKSNTIQLKTLQQTRDNLLPKLMSGEARVN